MSLPNHIKWEQVVESHIGGATAGTFRAKVPGGWLLKSYEHTQNLMGQVGFEWRLGMVFVPDPDHMWQLDTIKVEAQNV